MGQAQQLAGLQTSMTAMLAIMKAATPAIQANAKAMADLDKSTKDAEKSLKRTESFLGRFIGTAEKGILRKQTGGMGFVHRMMYGVKGYFITKNRLDGILSGIDKFIVRPLSGLKDDGEKQGILGKVFFGLGGSYRKTKQQLETIMDIATDAELDVFGPQVFGPKQKGGGGQAREKVKGDMKQKFMNAKVVKMSMKYYTMEKKYEKFNTFLASKGKKWMKSAGSALRSVGVMGLMFVKFAIFATLALAGVFLVLTFLKKVGVDGEKIKEIAKGMWNIITHFGGAIWDALIIMKDGFMDMYDAFMSGDVVAFVLAWLDVIYGFILVVWNLFLMIAIPLFWAMVSFLETVIVGVKGAIMDWMSDKWDTVHKILNALAMAGTIVMLIGAFVAAFFTGAWIPALIAMIVGGVIAIVSSLLDNILPFADGGSTGRGMSLVGERGPELVRLPTGSRVHSNAESKQMMSGGGGNNITVNVQGRIGASDSELRQIATKVSQIINKEINRTTSSRGLGA